MEAPDFLVEDLLDLPSTGDEFLNDSIVHRPNDNNKNNNSTGSSTPVHSSNSSFSGPDTATSFPLAAAAADDAHFSGSELCVPYDELAELEWLSNFVDDSFSTDDDNFLHKFQPTSGPPNGPAHFHRHHHPNIIVPNPIILKPETMVPGKARSKLSRVAPSDWSTRLLIVDSHVKKPPVPKRRRECRPGSMEGDEARRCLHCASEKTPQWRTGPMGPKTLCNACGVRYKSGRLVPEYRPASSPTFLATKHSNSHRKVLELRRQNELRLQQHRYQGQLVGSRAAVFGVSNGDDDYLIPRHF